jgi:beta-phosphoglucomutase family hydrolase
MIKGIIFDMDGLMIDSEPFHQQAFNKALKKYGKSLTPEENSKLYVGITDLDAAEDIIKRKKLFISKEKLVKQKQENYYKLLATKVISQPGLIELLKKLKLNGFKTAVASSSTLKEIKAVVDKLKINKYFNLLCSATHVKRGKPFPDVFLLAAKKLNLRPKECLVLEDAPSGVEAGKQANMKVFVIPSRETKNKDFSKADKVLTSLNQVFRYIKKQ